MLHELIETLENGAAIVDTDFKLIAHNRAWVSQWGFPARSRFIGQCYFDVLKRDKKTRSHHWDNAVSGIGIELAQHSFYSHNLEKEVKLDWFLKPVRDAAGAVTAIVCEIKILRPIEVELRKEKAERERLAFALSGANDGIWDWNFLSGDVYFSERYCGMLGYQKSDLSHTLETWERLVHPDDIESAKAAIDTYINTGGDSSYQSRFRMICKDGSQRWISSRGEIVEFSADGTPRRLAGTHTDISDQVELENQLLLAKKQAEDAAEAERVFLSTMSHEIRTPLSGMIGMLDTLVGSELSDEDKEKLTLARQSSGTLLGILNSILNLSELKSGTFELVKKDFNLKELFERGVAIYTSKAQQKNIKMEIDVKPSANRWANSDPERITQILYNLVSNAIKFSNAGTIGVTVSCTDSETVQNGMDLRLQVRDQGIGISEEDCSLIFKRFYQSDKRLDRSFQGSGLGLHIVHEIITAMGGEVTVESALGEGTAITVRLPICIGQYAAQTVTKVDGIKALAEKHVLVAEDIDVNVRILTTYLKRAGTQFTCVRNGEEAVAACAQKQYDLVLMDIQMPKMNGLEATEVIRRDNTAYRNVPIIALTANVFAQDVQSYFDIGMTDHLAKPFTFNELIGTLKRYLLAPKKSVPTLVPMPAAQSSEPMSAHS